MRVNSRRVIVAVPLLCGVLGALSCQQQTAAPAYAEPDFSAGHRALWAVFPKETVFAFSTGTLGHFTERTRAALRVLSAGPEAKKVFTDFRDKLTAEVGSDLFADETWTNEGVDLNGPAGIALLPSDKFILAVTAKDATKAAAFLKAKLKQETLKCEAVDKLAVCYEGEANPLVKQVDQSMTAIAQAKITPEAQKLGVVAFANLAIAPGVKDAPIAYLQKSEAAYFALGAMPHVIRYRAGYLNPETPTLAPYFAVDPAAPSLVSVLRGDEDMMLRGVGSVKALWDLAKRTIPPETFDQAVAGFTVVSGLDAEKDLVQNLTGEAMWVGTQSSMFFLLGVRDDVAAKKLVERLDGLAGTGIAALKSQGNGNGMIEINNASSEKNGVKIYSYAVKLAMPATISITLDFSLFAAKGAIGVGFDANAANVALDRLTNRATSTDKLPSEASAAIKAGAGFVAYSGPNGALNWERYPFMKAATAIKRGVARSGDDSAAMREMDALVQLFYDGLLVGKSTPVGVFVDGWTNLL